MRLFRIPEHIRNFRNLQFACLRSLRAQVGRLQERIESGHAALSPLARELAALFEESETLTMGEAMKALPHARRTVLKSRFAELVEAGQIAARGKGRGAFYERV